jgi:LPXTG-site transpeptidase (sortase) family protein
MTVPRVRIQYQYPEAGVRLWIRWISLGASAVCFSWAGWFWLDERVHQAAAEELFRASSIPASVALPASAAPAAPVRRAPVAKLEIPRLGVSGYVEEGFDAATLRRAIGLSPSSAKPGGRGNVVLAAHRDTFFAGLRDARVGDIVHLEAPGGKTIHYRISKVFVVDPSESWVMRASPGRDVLTLITCYPFQFVGSAPSRLVVQALPVAAPTPLARNRV